MKMYLGDSVYADFERGMIKLTTENGLGPPSNEIFLETSVIDSLVSFVNKVSDENNGNVRLKWETVERAETNDDDNS